MANTIRQHPELSVPSDNYANAIGLIVKYKRSFTSEQSNLLTLMEDDLKSTGSCRLSLAKNGNWIIVFNSFALAKNSPITPVFNRE